MNQSIKKYLAEIGRAGGRASKRALSSEEARNMVRVREARRAFRIFYAPCFWSYDPNVKITIDDIPWVAALLMKHGGRIAWQAGHRLCR